MPTYATRADCLDYIEGLTIDDNDVFDRLIERAERDVDNAVGAVPLDPDTGLKFVPARLTSGDARTLMRATCAQVEYRLTMGEDFFIRPQYGKTKGPEFETEGALPIVGPKTWRELEGSGLLKLTTSWAASGGSAPPWSDFAYNINDDDAPDPRLRGTIRTP